MRWKIGVGVILVLLLAATLSMYRLWQEEKKGKFSAFKQYEKSLYWT
ncbi:hypothetical protein ACIXFL_04555 [Bacteroides fragilis]